jgi:hypothetical protein
LKSFLQKSFRFYFLHIFPVEFFLKVCSMFLQSSVPKTSMKFFFRILFRKFFF